MIVYSSKPLFFAATALMALVSFYGSELVAQNIDNPPMTDRQAPQFPPPGLEGPRQLNVPPGFPAQALAASAAEPCSGPAAATLAAVACGQDFSSAAHPAPAVRSAEDPEKKNVGKVSLRPAAATAQP